MILKSDLNAKNKITAIGALAVPVLKYSFGIINWRLEEIRKIAWKTRKVLTFYKMKQPKADIDSKEGEVCYNFKWYINQR